MSDHPVVSQPATQPATPIRWWQPIVLLGLTAAVTGGGIYWGQTHIVAGIENGFLEVAPEHLDFGEVWLQDKFQWTLPITNTSTESVEVLDIQSSCNCASIEPTSLVIAPGETADVKLTLDLTTLDPKEAAKEVRPFDVRVVPVIKGGLAQYTGWVVQGVVRNPLAFVPPSVDFGDDSVIEGKGCLTSGMVVEVTAHASTKALAVECDHATIKVAKVNGHDSRFRLIVQPHKELPKGPFKFTAWIHPITEGSRDAPFAAVPLRISGRVVPDIRVTPESLQLGPMNAGAVIERTVTLTSRTSTPFEVLDIDSESAGRIQVSRSLDEVKDVQALRHRFRVTLRATGFRSQTELVRFVVRFQEGGDRTEVALPIAFYVVGNEGSEN